MGYHAPDAEDVYRYIFRLDRHYEAGLSDGFGWSILFVNDNSPACREFLLRYGAELCHRTADRIRFVFFSGLDTTDTQELAEQANSRGGGFLSSIISAAAEWASLRRRYDWERDPWERFRPEAFRPLDSGERLDHHLSMECEIYSAMPGSREALRFAQRLGIGRFVPCFLMFSDIGAPVIRLLPVGHYTPDQVFSKLRNWIDSFYEVNHAILMHWANVETAIQETCRRFRTSVDRVDQWKRERAERWQALQRLSGYLTRLAHASPNATLLKEISADWKLPWEARNLISSCATHIESCERQQTEADEVKGWIDKLLRVSTNPQMVLRELSDFQHRHRLNLTESVKALLSDAVHLFTTTSSPPAPERQLLDWWRSEYGRPPSRNQYDKHRSSWASYSKAKYGETAVGRVADILRDEFAVILRTALAQPISHTPERAASEVLAELRSYLGVRPDDASWEDSVSLYRQVLTGYFTQLKTHAPSWIMEFGSLPSSTLCWGDCILTVEQRQKSAMSNCLDKLPLLNTLLKQVTFEWDSYVGTAEATRREQQQQALIDLTGAMRQWVSSASLLDADKYSAWIALISSLSGIRQDMEEQAFANGKRLASTSYPGEVFNRKDASQLMRLLDDYDTAVASLRFPFETDPDVLRVALDTSPLEASGIAIRDRAAVPIELAKSRVIEAVTDAETSVKQWPSVKREAVVWSPAGSLCSSLSRVVQARRLKELLAVIGADTVDGALEVLTSRREMARLLDALDVQELLAVERLLAGDIPRTGKSPASKQELFESIFVAVGLLPQSDDGVLAGADSGPREKIDILSEKVKRGAFDVFLAHNSQDRPAILRLGRQLRAQGIYPWIDVEQIPPGRWFQDVIQSAVRSVKAAAIVIGESGVGRWEAVELRAFVSRCVEHGIPLIPVLLPGTASIPEDLTFLRELNCVKFTHDVTEEDGISRLVWGITGEKPRGES